jgi:hypothetical protein
VCSAPASDTQIAKMREWSAEIGAGAPAWVEKLIAKGPTCNEAHAAISKLGGRVAELRGGT